MHTLTTNAPLLKPRKHSNKQQDPKRAKGYNKIEKKNKT